MAWMSSVTRSALSGESLYGDASPAREKRRNVPIPTAWPGQHGQRYRSAAAGDRMHLLLHTASARAVQAMATWIGSSHKTLAVVEAVAGKMMAGVQASVGLPMGDKRAMEDHRQVVVVNPPPHVPSRVIRATCLVPVASKGNLAFLSVVARQQTDEAVSALSSPAAERPEATSNSRSLLIRIRALPQPRLCPAHLNRQQANP